MVMMHLLGNGIELIIGRRVTVCLLGRSGRNTLLTVALPDQEDGPRGAFATLAADGLCFPGRLLMGWMGNRCVSARFTPSALS